YRQQHQLPSQHQRQQQQQQHQQLQALAHMSALSPPMSSPNFAAGGTLAAVAPIISVSSTDLNMAAAPLNVVGLHAPPSAANFGSETTNLEYAILSSMLSYPMFSNSPLGPVIEGADMSVNGAVPMPNSLWAPPQQERRQPASLSSLLLPSPHPHMAPAVSDNTGQMAHADQNIFEAAGVAANGGSSLVRRQEQWQPRSMAQQQMHHFQGHQQAHVHPSPPPHAQIVSDDTHLPLSRPSTTGPAVYGLNPVYPQSPAEVYSSVTEPHKYYSGFHFFFRHISGRMDKKDIMRVSRAIAHFRPSLVAQLRNLTHDDLVFMEKS
ncbi:Transcriptional regulator of nonfermentable carbon utilization, partial [Coemansia furcata]